MLKDIGSSSIRGTKTKTFAHRGDIQTENTETPKRRASKTPRHLKNEAMKPRQGKRDTKHGGTETETPEHQDTEALKHSDTEAKNPRANKTPRHRKNEKKSGVWTEK